MARAPPPASSEGEIFDRVSPARPPGSSLESAIRFLRVAFHNRRWVRRGAEPQLAPWKRRGAKCSLKAVRGKPQVAADGSPPQGARAPGPADRSAGLGSLQLEPLLCRNSFAS
eukprot:GHVT01024831.1.p1 GENE.GHVT01024831.1~~GHVT01024831.1.p1  ORF type:complete len:113 (-),score=25.72 GHVT01024831.1:169-507(-)